MYIYEMYIFFPFNTQLAHTFSFNKFLYVLLIHVIEGLMED